MGFTERRRARCECGARDPCPPRSGRAPARTRPWNRPSRDGSVALIQPKVERTAPPASEPAADRVPESLARGTPEPIRKELVELLGADRVLARVSDLVRYASDASPYRLLPKVVVMAHDGDDVAKVLDYGRLKGIPVTFRGGGTSLSGQAQSDGILVDVRRHWTG